ncbi:hypothetical protein NDU88_005361 [Pleurodeles waltl]|uniref:Uncharacterized protein n=1 Tax=Pleurodeles waltl TaxID=8319 RepID=A0AAV7SLF8_PLEWA|nr:hypothetical protein NDU88_005361 [Pleurodeles waltl]
MEQSNRRCKNGREETVEERGEALPAPVLTRPWRRRWRSRADLRAEREKTEISGRGRKRSRPQSGIKGTAAALPHKRGARAVKRAGPLQRIGGCGGVADDGRRPRVMTSAGVERLSLTPAGEAARAAGPCRRIGGCGGAADDGRRPRVRTSAGVERLSLTPAS